MTSRLLSFSGGGGQRGECGGGGEGRGAADPEGSPHGANAARWPLRPLPDQDPINDATTASLSDYPRLPGPFEHLPSVLGGHWTSGSRPQDGQRQDNTLRWEETTDEGLQLIAFALYVCVCLR